MPAMPGGAGELSRSRQPNDMNVPHHEEGVMSTGDRLIYMANQIARNCAAEGDDRGALTVRDHIRLFWDPAMRARIIALAQEKPEAFSPIAARAVKTLTDS